MITLERFVNSTTNVFCYEETYGFTLFTEYKAVTNLDGNYLVIDDDGIEVIFETENDLKKVFMIE